MTTQQLLNRARTIRPVRSPNGAAGSTTVRRATTSELYQGASRLTGPLQRYPGPVRYRTVLTVSENGTLLAMAAAHLLIVAAFVGYLARPSHLPVLAGHGLPYQVLAVTGSVAIFALQVVALLQTLSLVLFAARARDPIPRVPEAGLRVAMLTTIIPSKEPWDIAERTLLAMQRQQHDGLLDVWVLDEENDPHVRARCAKLGINHFSRKGVAEWNQVEGPFRAKTKHGNHNAWRQVHEHRYDLISQMDPDHCPLETNDFLLRTIGYFRDPDVAYVVCPQVYGNLETNFIARGSAELAYLFHGVTQRGCNGMGAPVLIGTNHVFRPSAWAQMDGYQDCIIEDHLTAMRVVTEANPVTGNRWKGVYTPDILTVGEGPTTWSDFFSQQRRWAYGIFEIATQYSPRMFRAMTGRQRLSFAALQFFYPSVAVTWLLGNFLSALYLLGGVSSSRLEPAAWAVLFTGSTALGVGVGVWLRRFNLMPHERRSYNLTGMLLNLLTTPVYLAAGVAQLAGRPLTYKVTAKGRLATGDRWSTFRPQLAWIAVALVTMLVGLVSGHHFASLYVWMTWTLVLCLVPLVMSLRNRVRTAHAPAAEAPAGATLTATAVRTSRSVAHHGAGHPHPVRHSQHRPSPYPRRRPTPHARPVPSGRLNH